jgi:hypothetical protein
MKNIKKYPAKAPDSLYFKLAKEPSTSAPDFGMILKNIYEGKIGNKIIIARKMNKIILSMAIGFKENNM